MVSDLFGQISGVVAILIALYSVVSAEWSVGELAESSWEFNGDSCGTTLGNNRSSGD
jgi:hypothetical protein